MVFSKEGQYAIFLEFTGWYADMPYEIKKDSLLLGNVMMSKYVMLSCNCEQVVLATINKGDQSDTLVLKPYDMGYWLIHQHNFAPQVRAYFSQNNESQGFYDAA